MYTLCFLRCPALFSRPLPFPPITSDDLEWFFQHAQHLRQVGPVDISVLAIVFTIARHRGRTCPMAVPL
jgi:hypothetical protein